MTKEQILAALAPLYQAGYDEYASLTDLSVKLLQEDEDRAYKVIARRAVNKSHFLDGMRTAAEALGIPMEELVAAAANVQGFQSTSPARGTTTINVQGKEAE